MFTARKFRIYPNKEQELLLNQHIDCVRLVYNLALETKNTAYSEYNTNLSRYDLQKQLPDLKKHFPFLSQVNAQSYQSALKDLDNAFTVYFRNLKNGVIESKKRQYLEKRAKKSLKINWDFYHHIGKPKFKCKRESNQSFGVPQNWTITDNKLFIPKLKTGIKVKISRNIEGKTLEAKISKTATGKWYISFGLKTDQEIPVSKEIKEETTIGIDLGIKTFAVLSDGTEYENHKFLKQQINRLKYGQRKLSKKKKGSKNQEKQRLKVAKLYEKVSNQRGDYLHKITSAITKQYDTVVLEDLNIKGMMQNSNLALSISDVGWYSFKEMLTYKLIKTGGNLIIIDRWFPSSKIHNKCGFVNQSLKLSDREWTCPNCGDVVNRDLNAAINIKNSGLGKPVEIVEIPSMEGSVKQESHYL